MITCKPVLIVCLTSVTFLKAAECNLENVFRTPKDRTKINFDHLELIERADFERLETTTTTELPLTSSKEPGFAHAQVSIRFGGDEVHGSHNHIMKIPPQARHHGCPNELFYPPPQHRYDHPHYYHPYPPPVPFNFPNYYFCNYGPGGHTLPPQLREYFGRHPEFLDGSYPKRREQVFIWGRPLKKEDLVDHVTVNVTNVEENLTKQVEVVNATLKLTNEKIEDQVEKMLQKKEETTTPHEKFHITHRHKKSGKKKSTHSSYSHDLKELEHLLEKALKTFKCDESSEESTFVTYPVTEKKTHSITDLDNLYNGCDKDRNSTKPDGKKFSNDLDDLLTVVVGVMDQPEVETKNPVLPPVKENEWFPTNWIMVPLRGTSIPPNLENPKLNFCHKCGRKHLGGNFCSHCGAHIHHHSKL